MKNTIENIIISVIVGSLVFFSVHWSNQITLDKMTIYNQTIIDSLTKELGRKVTYQINNEFTRIRAKKDSEIKIILDNQMNLDSVKQEQKRRKGWFQRR